MIKKLAFLVLGCLVTTSSLKAAISISGKAAGRFENAIGPASMVVSGIGTSKLSWAKTLSNSAVQNEFEFIPSEFSASEYEYFSLGRFRYGNGVTETNTQADEVDLVIDLELQDGVSRPFSFTIDTAVTVNTDNPEFSSDTIRLKATAADSLLFFEGSSYALHIQFGKTSAEGFSRVSKFDVFEEKVAEAEIRAIITPISSVTGASIAKFENPTGPEGMDVAGVGTDVFSWGKPLSQGGRSNQFAFTGKDFETSTEVPFTIGTFEYYNGTVGISTQADTVDLEITVSIPDLELETFVFPLEITGTPNNSDREASADIVRIVEPVAERTLELDGRIFAMRLAFGDTSENGFSEIERFFVFEDSSAQADLKATLTEVLPPDPSNAVLEIHTAVEVRINTLPGKSYQVESSTDLKSWVEEGDVIVGSGQMESRFYSTMEHPKKVYRVIVEPN